MSEIELVELVTNFLRTQNYSIRHEVPNMGQSVDIVACKGRYVMALEAKIADWKRALKQCDAHVHVADYISLVLARKIAPPALLTRAEDSGYGLILCDPNLGQCRWEIYPRLNRQVWQPQRRAWSKTLRKISYAH